MGAGLAASVGEQIGGRDRVDQASRADRDVEDSAELGHRPRVLEGAAARASERPLGRGAEIEAERVDEASAPAVERHDLAPDLERASAAAAKRPLRSEQRRVPAAVHDGSKEGDLVDIDAAPAFHADDLLIGQELDRGWGAATAAVRGAGAAAVRQAVAGPQLIHEAAGAYIEAQHRHGRRGALAVVERRTAAAAEACRFEHGLSPPNRVIAGHHPEPGSGSQRARRGSLTPPGAFPAGPRSRPKPWSARPSSRRCASDRG